MIYKIYRMQQKKYPKLRKGMNYKIKAVKNICLWFVRALVWLSEHLALSTKLKFESQTVSKQ